MPPDFRILRRMCTSKQKYAALPQEIGNGGFADTKTARAFRISKSTRAAIVCSLLLFWTIAVITATWYLSRLGLRNQKDGLHLYSPLQNIVEYEHRVFNQGLWNERTIYMGTPTKETTRAWEDIVEHGIIKLNASDEEKLFDHTVRWLNNPEFFIGGVEVFHQLHCLYRIRKHIWAEYPTIFYGKENQGIHEVEHIDHCIDYLRQVIMCHGDIGIITWRYNSDKTRHFPNFNMTKSCRKFEPLVEWSDAHQAGNATPGGINDSHN